MWRLPLLTAGQGDTAADAAAAAAAASRDSADAAPVFSARMRTVTAGVGAPAPPALDFSVEEAGLARITQVKNGVRRWRKNAVVTATAQPLNGADDGGRLLCDSEFHLPPRKRAVEVKWSRQTGRLFPLSDVDLDLSRVVPNCRYRAVTMPVIGREDPDSPGLPYRITQDDLSDVEPDSDV
jgi:hypothetical protein